MKKVLILVLGLVFISNSVHAQGVNFYRDLSVGATGDDVTTLQTWLISNGFDIPAISSGAASKGYFGMQTKMAVMKMQMANGIPNTGYVGPLTRGKLNGNSQGKALIVTLPNGNESLVRNTTYNITWTGSPGILDQSGTIRLVPYMPPCADPSYGGPRCMIAVREPYLITNGISLFKTIMAWNVGSILNSTETIPDGQYKIQICSNNSSVCDSSDNYFNIVSSSSGLKTPVVNGVQAPTTLKVGELGTWRVNVTDPQNGTLTYSVNWGDNLNVISCPSGYVCQPNAASASYVAQQGSTFTHAYSQPGTYTIQFTITNNVGLSTNATVTVTVTGQASRTPRVVSPNGGEQWLANSTQVISWDATGTGVSKVDLYLDEDYTFNCGPGGTCIRQLRNYILDRNIDATKAYGWIVATDINNVQIPDGTWKVRVCEAGSTTNCDTSDKSFRIWYGY